MRILLLVAAFLVAIASPAFAQDGWVAAKVKQPARYTTDSRNWVTIQPGTAVPKASWIHVGPRGRLILRRGRESIVYKANTLAGLVQKTKGRKTQIRQQVGNLTIDVQKRAQPHVTVDTPFLAAVVKGTKFTTKTNRNSTELKVDRGQVQVTRPDSGERTEVNSRQSVQVDVTSPKPMQIKGPGPKAPVVLVKPTKPVVQAAAGVQRVSVDRSLQPNTNTDASDRRQSQGDNSPTGAGVAVAQPVAVQPTTPTPTPAPTPGAGGTPNPTASPTPAPAASYNPDDNATNPDDAPDSVPTTVSDDDDDD